MLVVDNLLKLSYEIVKIKNLLNFLYYLSFVVSAYKLQISTRNFFHVNRALLKFCNIFINTGCPEKNGVSYADSLGEIKAI